jgi:hypothetical protein
MLFLMKLVISVTPRPTRINQNAPRRDPFTARGPKRLKRLGKGVAVHLAVRERGKQLLRMRPSPGLGAADLSPVFRETCAMLKKVFLSFAAFFAALVTLPATAEAGGRRSYDSGYYDSGYYDSGYYDRGYYDRGYYDRDYYPRHYRKQYRKRQYGHYDRGYDDRYYGRRHRRCGSGTTGAIIGGAAGALLGREVGRGGGSRYGYYRHRRGGGTTGAILGGAVGALVGREIGRSC